MMDRSNKIGVADRSTLAIGDRHQRHVAETEVKRAKVRQILAAMQCRDCAVCKGPKQGKVELVDMKMQDIEVPSAFAHPIKHQHIIGNWVADVRIKPQGG